MVWRNLRVELGTYYEKLRNDQQIWIHQKPLITVSAYIDLNVWSLMFIQQWQAFLVTRPDQQRFLSSDVAELDQVTRTIGDYKLKQSATYKPADQSWNTTLYKLNQLIEAKRKVSADLLT